MNINWTKAIGYGVLVWLVLFALGSVLVAYNSFGNIWSGPAMILAVVALTYAAAFLVQPKSIGEGIVYGATWVAIGLVLDWIVAARFNSGIFTSWSVWIGYALMLLTPSFEEEFNRPDARILPR